MIGKEILEFYFTENKKIHISCDNDRFYNGKIFKIDFERKLIIFNDCKLGHIPVSILNLKTIEPFVEKEK